MLGHFLNTYSQYTELTDMSHCISGSVNLEMLMSGAVKPELDITDDNNLWNNNDDLARILNYGNIIGSEFQTDYHIPRTVSCPPDMAAKMAGIAVAERKQAAVGRESSRKRKAEKTQTNKVVVADEKPQEKKMKSGSSCLEDQESKNTDQNSNSKSTTTTINSINNKINNNDKNQKGSSDNNNPSKVNSKAAASDAPKPDYIHVRARRGQATDSHSLAERVRREKISERMRYLQDLVPGCNKVTGKAGMLDEIINYVQSLQKQVEFLSMKLAAMNPTMGFDAENYLAKEVHPICTSNIPAAVGVSSSLSNSNHHHLHDQLNALSQGISFFSSMGIGGMINNPQDVTTLRRTISAPVSIPDAFFDSSSCLNLPNWDDDLQNLYNMVFQQGRSPTVPFMTQPFTAGFVDASHVKQEI